MKNVDNYECRIPTEEISDMDYLRLTDAELLAVVVGTREAKRLYNGTLASLFKPDDAAPRAHHKLAAARELLKRWLMEEMKRDQVFSSPTMVIDYLRTHFAGQEHETFVGLFLDTQHRL